MPPSIDRTSPTHCPRCNMPGDLASSTPAFKTYPDGRREHRGRTDNFVCRNERCRWYNTGWIVQTLPDGTVPERKKGEKDFPVRTPESRTRARDALKRDGLIDPRFTGDVITDEALRDTEPKGREATEIRNPFA